MISGGRIGLRALERADLPQLQIWRNNERMRRYYREYRELSLWDQESWYSAVCCNNKNFCMFGIAALRDCEQTRTRGLQLLGVCGLTNINWIIRSAEVSLYIGHNDIYIDDILAPDVLRTICVYAFNVLNMHKIWAEIYAFDDRKKSLFEYFGMHLDGTLRDNAFDDGRYCDSLVYSLKSTELK